GNTPMRALISVLLTLNIVHFPVPFPDLDGECRGVPIHSLAEFQAWHILALGVTPNADIDQGPIPSDENRPANGSSSSPFGDADMISRASSCEATSGLDCLFRSAELLTLWISLPALTEARSRSGWCEPPDSGRALAPPAHHVVLRI